MAGVLWDDDTVIHAPAQLPIAPRPISTELLSSWLLRVAAANQIPLCELLDALESQHGSVLTNDPFDYAVPRAAVKALSRFCRVAPRAVRMLDLRERLPRVASGTLLRFRNVGYCPRHTRGRVRYSFCPSCLVEQKVIHVRWDWSLSCLIRCAVHRRPLLEGCPVCGEPDPLVFTVADSPSSLRCRSCDGNLVGSAPGVDDRDGDMQAVEDAYRAALAGTAPELMKKVTARELQLFVEDMFDLLIGSLNGRPDCGPATFSRQDILEIIAALILNAVPGAKESGRWRRGTRGIRLWATLISVIPEYVGTTIEKTSFRWPAALRRRFLSALHYRTRRRWPYTPYRAAAQVGRLAMRADIAAVYRLRPSVLNVVNGLSSI